MQHSFFAAGTFSLAVLLLAASCDKLPSQKQKTENGLEYQMVVDNKETPNAQLGDFITLHITYLSDKDSVLNSTHNMGVPITSRVSEPMFKGAFEEGLLLLSAGDSAKFWIPSDSIFKGQPEEHRPKFLPKGSKIGYFVKVEKVEKADQIGANQVKAIEAYGKKKGLKVETTESGLSYAITQPAEGPKAAVGDTVSVHYVGTTLEGGVEFDNSRQRNQPFNFPVGKGFVIPGWDEALQLFPKGTKATLLIPSKLAYGESGAPGSPIGPNAALVFEIEVMDVKPAKKAAENQVKK